MEIEWMAAHKSFEEVSGPSPVEISTLHVLNVSNIQRMHHESRSSLHDSKFDTGTQVKLYTNTNDRRKYEDLADFYAIIKSLEHLEAAYVRDDVTQEQYTEACTKLLSQFKTAEVALRLGSHIKDIDSFISANCSNCQRASERLRVGVPATLLHNTTNRKKDSVVVAQTVQHFITLMDVLKLNMRAVDEIQPLLTDMMASLTQISGLPPDFEGRKELEGWVRTLNSMRASEELIDDQIRQLSYNLERSYASFISFLNQ